MLNQAPLEVNRLHRRRGIVWERRYQAILVSEEEPAQVDRLRYLLAHGVKEGLVAHARDWPGVHCVREILAGEPIRGLWFDRTKEFAARNRGESFGRLTYATEETLVLTPLPCWAHLSPEAYRQRVADLVEAIESEAAAALAASGRVPMGVAGVLRQSPETPSCTEQEISGAALPCRRPSRAEGVLGSLCRLRGGFSGCFRKRLNRRIFRVFNPIEE